MLCQLSAADGSGALLSSRKGRYPVGKMAGAGADDAPAPIKPGKVAAVVAFYFVISISLVFLNKVLLSSPGASIDAPLFVTW